MTKNVKIMLVIGAAALLLAILLGRSVFYIIKPGERAIIFRPFTTGLDTINTYGDGFHIVAPWNDFIVYNIKERKTEETMDVLDKNGMSVSVDVSVRFNPNFSKLPYLHRRFGEDFTNQLVIPEVRSTVRQVMGRYTAEEIYSKKRAEVELAIIQEATHKLNENYIITKAVLIRSINLPPDIKKAIENKLQQEQESLAYEFRLEKERKEAERKIIAAEGESKSNNIINQSLTPSLLKMRGIEATITLANSPNSKIVVIGSGQDGLPLILNNN